MLNIKQNERPEDHKQENLIGLFQKKIQTGVEDIFSRKTDQKIFDFLLYPWKFWTKQNFPQEISQNCVTPLEIQRPKTNTLGNSIFFLITTGISTSFLINPGISTCYFLSTPEIPRPTTFLFEFFI